MAKRPHLRSNRSPIVKLSKKFLKNNQSLKLERLNYMEKYRAPYQERRRKVGWDLYKLLDIKKGDYKKTLDFK